MATRSRIGIENQDGTVTSIYCHWDGHPDTAGATLLKHYTNESKIRALIALGDLSTLGDDLYTERGTVSYARDRKESSAVAKTHAATAWPDSDQAFEYVFALHGEWMYKPARSSWFSLLKMFQKDS